MTPQLVVLAGSGLLSGQELIQPQVTGVRDGFSHGLSWGS